VRLHFLALPAKDIAGGDQDQALGVVGGRLLVLAFTGHRARAQLVDRSAPA